ncbi:MAG: hypothetical protein AB1512_02965 [Thermodesulfobacteriota bacterium]
MNRGFEVGKRRRREYKARLLILELLKYRGGMCKCQLAHYTGEPLPFVSNLVDDLATEDLIVKDDFPRHLTHIRPSSGVDDGIYSYKRAAA